MKNFLLLLLINSSLFFFSNLKAQSSVSFALKTSPSVNLVFDSFEKYQNGVVLLNALTLKVETVGTGWDLYVGTTTATPSVFDVNNSYGSSGSTSIPVSILQARVFNTSNTSNTHLTFFGLTDIATPQYIIGSAATGEADVACYNAAGSYTTSPACYNFKVDLKAKPGLGYRAGSYSLRVDFIIAEDL